MARLTFEEQVEASVAPKTAGGRDARIDGDVAWESTDPNVIVVTSTGERSALVTAVNTGVAQLFAVFDADLGEGVREMTASAAVEVVEAEAASVEITFGTPVPQPPPVEPEPPQE